MYVIAWGAYFISLFAGALGRRFRGSLEPSATGGRFRNILLDGPWVWAIVVGLPFGMWSWQLGLWIMCYALIGIMGWKFLPATWGYLLLPLALIFENFGVEHRVSMMNLALGLASLWLTKPMPSLQNAHPLRLLWGSVWSPMEGARNSKSRPWNWLAMAGMLSLGLFEISLATWSGGIVATSPEFAGSASPADALVMFLSITLWFFLGLDGAYRVVRALTAVFGFRVPSNFDHPWRALDVADHWRRWHVPVMRWLNFFIYTPARVKLRRWRHAHVVLTFLIFLIAGQLIRTGWGSLIWGILNSILVLITPALFGQLRRALEAWGRFGIQSGILICGTLTLFLELLMKPLVAMDLDLYNAILLRILDAPREGWGVSSLWDDFVFVFVVTIVIFRLGEWAEQFFESKDSEAQPQAIEFLFAFSIPIIFFLGLLLIRSSGIPYIGGD